MAVKFVVGRICRGGMGNYWFVQGVSEEDKTHPFVQKQLFNMQDYPSDRSLLTLAMNNYRVSPSDIRFLA